MRTIWEVVEAVGRDRPDAPALCGEYRAGYGELLERAEELSGELLARVRPGQVVAVEAATSGMAALILLAAARARCPILPIDPTGPALHRAALIQDARPGVCVRELAPDKYELVPVPGAASTTGAPESAGGDGAAPDGSRAALATDPTDPPDLREIAYVLCTSGTTGRPKGVMVGHEALVERLRGMAAYPGFGPDDSFLGMAAVTFDVWLAEALMPLTVGGAVVVAPARARQDPETFATVVHRHRPSVLQATPSFWRLALAAGWEPAAPVDRIWSGGEALTPSLARSLLPRCGQLWNVYGPTETTIWATCALVRDPDAIELGAPVPGTGVCLVDAAGALVTGPGEQGEILIYGSGLADGYLRRPELTAERFPEHDTPEGRRRCYRTGDLARYRDDGALEYLGRTDGQIKLRGHRVELGGIEAVAEAHPAVSEAVAVLCDADRPQSTHIALFVVATGALGAREVRQWLAERLPAGSRPGRVTVAPSLPRTSSGKVDRVALARRQAAENRPS
jgi:amino acid adenylation domain-containing protein